MKLVAGIAALNTPDLFASATRRIILHAAVYGAFLRSQPHCEGLETALRKPGFRRLDIIAVAPAQGPTPVHNAQPDWDDPFLEALRFGISRHGVRDEVASSYRFLLDLAHRHPDTVRVHRARRLPCLPVIVADDTIIFGQYAHACCHAPHGFWGMVHADVELLLQWATCGKPPYWAQDTQIAAFRLVSECVRAMEEPPAMALHTPCPGHCRNLLPHAPARSRDIAHAQAAQ